MAIEQRARHKDGAVGGGGGDAGTWRGAHIHKHTTALHAWSINHIPYAMSDRKTTDRLAANEGKE